MADFEDGFFAGYYGKSCPEYASDMFIDGYIRGKRTREEEIKAGME